MEYRIEHDSMGEMKVPADRLWAAQTQRSHENFEIGVGIETMPAEIMFYTVFHLIIYPFLFKRNVYFKIETASVMVFSRASRPYLSTSALFFSP